MTRKKIVLKRLALLMGVFLLTLLATSPTQATPYYVSSSSGDDDYNGLYSTYQGGVNGPWKTIHKINEQAFEPGDTIKFRRGDTWITWPWGDGVLTPSSSGTDAQRITFKNYGTGNLPLFRGSRQVVSSDYQWTESSSGINEYYCEVAGGGDPWLFEVKVVEADSEGLLYKDEPGSLADHEWGCGDKDLLGFNTVYIRDCRGAPGSQDGFQSILASQSNCIKIDGVSYIDIDGIETRNGNKSICIVGDAHHNRIMNCVLRYNDNGIWAWADEHIGGDNEVYNCNASYNYRQGIMSCGEGKGFSLIQNNLCEYNGRFGIWVGQHYDGCIIEYNECRYNGSYTKEPLWGYWGIEVLNVDPITPYIIRYNSSHHNVIPQGFDVGDGGGINIRADDAAVYYNL